MMAEKDGRNTGDVADSRERGSARCDAAATFTARCSVCCRACAKASASCGTGNSGGSGILLGSLLSLPRPHPFRKQDRECARVLFFFSSFLSFFFLLCQHCHWQCQCHYWQQCSTGSKKKERKPRATQKPVAQGSIVRRRRQRAR